MAIFDEGCGIWLSNKERQFEVEVEGSSQRDVLFTTRRKEASMMLFCTR
jgi:hypothetical protein